MRKFKFSFIVPNRHLPYNHIVRFDITVFSKPIGPAKVLVEMFIDDHKVLTLFPDVKVML